MRVFLGRIALLIGIAIVAAMAWYGAVALFGEDKSSDDDADPSAERDCEASTERQARAARRAFQRTYVKRGAHRWLSGAGVSHTDVLDEFDVAADVAGDGSVLLVMKRADGRGPELPACIDDVPVVVVTGGPFQFR